MTRAELRQTIVERERAGERQCDIARDLKVTPNVVIGIVNRARGYRREDNCRCCAAERVRACS